MDPRILAPIKTLVRTEERTIRLMTDGDKCFIEKRVRRTEKRNMEQLKREIATWKVLLDVEGVVPYDYASVRPGMIIVITEYWPEGDLHEFILNNELSMQLICQIFYTIAVALYRIHKLGVAHRDIKLENVLIRSSTRAGFAYETGIIDFGLSVFSEGLQSSSVGTLSYAAPEVWSDQRLPYNPFIADVWSLGVLLYAMVERQYPFAGNTPDDIRREINRTPKWHSWNDPTTDPLVVLLNGMLTIEPSERMTLHEVVCSPFLRKYLPYDLLPFDVGGENIRSLSEGSLHHDHVTEVTPEPKDQQEPSEEGKKERKISPRAVFKKVMASISKK